MKQVIKLNLSLYIIYIYILICMYIHTIQLLNHIGSRFDDMYHTIFRPSQPNCIQNWGQNLTFFNRSLKTNDWRCIIDMFKIYSFLICKI